MKKNEPTIQDILEAVNNGFSLMEERIDEKFKKMKKELKKDLEETLEKKLEEKLEEKLAPIRQEIFSIKQDLLRIENRLDMVIKANNEDGFAMNKEIEKLKRKVQELELKVKILETSKR